MTSPRRSNRPIEFTAHISADEPVTIREEFASVVDWMEANALRARRLAQDEWITDPKKLPSLLTVAEVAKLLRTTAKAVYAMSERGRLQGARRPWGTRILFDRDALLSLLARGGLR